MTKQDIYYPTKWVTVERAQELLYTFLRAYCSDRLHTEEYNTALKSLDFDAVLDPGVGVSVEKQLEHERSKREALRIVENERVAEAIEVGCAGCVFFLSSSKQCRKKTPHSSGVAMSPTTTYFGQGKPRPMFPESRELVVFDAWPCVEAFSWCGEFLRREA